MTSNRPYLIRALYEWIGDNGLTPYLMVDAAAPGVRVPPQTVKDGRVVLNIAARAVNRLELANDVISFQARFSGVPMLVLVPVDAVLAVYAMENGQGMLFPAEPPSDEEGDAADTGDDGAGAAESAAPDDTPAGGGDEDAPPPRPARGPHLRVVK
jgi:stringent starvation protein B